MTHPIRMGGARKSCRTAASAARNRIASFARHRASQCAQPGPLSPFPLLVFPSDNRGDMKPLAFLSFLLLLAATPATLPVEAPGRTALTIHTPPPEQGAPYAIVVDRR